MTSPDSQEVGPFAVHRLNGTNATAPDVKTETNNQSLISKQSLPNIRMDLPARARFELMLEEVMRDHHSRQRHQATGKRDISSDRDAFVAACQSCCMSNAHRDSVSSVPTIRSQLLAEFIHLHYARAGEDFFPSKMILILSPETSTLTAATDALYLAQLAIATRDQRLLRNAARSYQSARQLLRRDLLKHRACYDDHVFGAIHVLSLCEAFNGVSINDSHEDHHSKALAMLFQARGPKSLHNVYMMIQLQQHHHRVLLEGLLSRKRPLIGRGAWLNVEKNCHLMLTSLTTLALRVPGALEDADFLIKKGAKANLDEIFDTLAELKSLETRLQNWMAGWYAKANVSPYWHIPSSQLPWLPKANTFSSGLEFPTPLAAKAHVLYWMPLLALREVTKEVAELHPFPLLATTSQSQHQMLQEAVEECAAKLCMTAMFLTNPANGIDGCMEACGPLLLASSWFRRANDHEKLMWCHQMLTHIESQGLRLPRLSNEAWLANG